MEWTAVHHEDDGVRARTLTLPCFDFSGFSGSANQALRLVINYARLSLVEDLSLRSQEVTLGEEPGPSNAWVPVEHQLRKVAYHLQARASDHSTHARSLPGSSRVFHVTRQSQVITTSRITFHHLHSPGTFPAEVFEYIVE